MEQKKKIIYFAIILVSLVILFVPLITHNHIYQGVALGRDTEKTFIPFMNSATEGASLVELVQRSPYLGLAVTMWCLGIINKVLHMDPGLLFFLYSSLILIGVALTMYYLGKLVGGVRTGWIVMVMGLLCSTSVFALYSVGCIVNIINVYIVFLWAVMLLAKWRERHKWYWLVSGVALLALFTVWHPTGAYLPFTVAILLVGLMISWLITKKKVNWIYICTIIIGLLGSSFLVWHNVEAINVNAVGFGGDTYIGYLLHFFHVFLVPAPTVISIMVIVALWRCKRTVTFNGVTKDILAVLVCLLVLLVVTALLRVTVLPGRQIVDASGVLAIITGIVLGRLVVEKNLYWLKLISYALMIVASLITLWAWVI